MEPASVLSILVEAKGITSVNSGLSLIQANLKKTGVTATAGIGVVAVAGAAAAKQLYDLGEKFDEAYHKIRTGTGATGDAMKELEEDFKAVYTKTPAGMDDVATAISDVHTRLGLAKGPLREMSLGLIRLSRFTDTDLETNIKNVARAFVDWEVPVQRQMKSLDGLYRLQQKSGASVAEITSNVQKFGSPLRTLGWTVGEAAAMFANFERAGVNIQTMVPGLKLAIGNLVDPTDELRDKLSGLGVATKNPEKALRQIMDLLGKGSDLKTLDKIDLAMDVFGKRAGADMAEAIKQGRFNLGEYVKVFQHGGDSLKKSAEDVSTVSGNMTMFGHQMEVAFEPLGRVVYDAVLKAAKALNSLNIAKAMEDVRQFTRTNQDFKDSVAAAAWLIKAFGKAVGFGMDIARAQIRGFWQYTRGVFTTLRGVVKVVSGVFTGDWGKAWGGVKDIFRGSAQIVIGVVRAMTAPIRLATSAIAKLLSGAFEGAWNTVKGIFRSGGNAVIGFLNAVISAINVIPGVDIGKIGKIGASGSAYSPYEQGLPQGHQTGGIVPGHGEGDSWRKKLPPGSFVLNKMATQAYGFHKGGMVDTILEPGERYFYPNEVKRIGLGRLQAMNDRVSRFHGGAPSGYLFGGVVDSVADVAGDIGGAALGAAGSVGHKILNQGADFVLGKLPKPNLPEPFSGVGPFVIDKAKSFITGAVKKFIDTHQEDYGTGRGEMFQGYLVADWIVPILQWAQKHGWTGSITSGYRDPGQVVSNPQGIVAPQGQSNHNSLRYPGGAIDVGDPGARAAGQALASVLSSYPLDPKLVWGAVIGDYGHFSATGHQKGGLITNPWFNNSTKKGNINGIWPSADLTKNPSGWYALQTLPGYVIGALAEAAGRHFGVDVPGRTMMQINLGEGGGKPGSVGTDPGGTVGRGPWAITNTPGNFETYVRPFSKTWRGMNNPVLNAAAMARMYKDRGTDPWYGTKYVTNWNADWTGKYQLRNALGGIGYSAALRSAMSGKAGVDNGEAGGLTDAQKARIAAGRRKTAREKAIQKDIAKIGKAETVRGRKTALWEVVMDYARWGVFGKKGRRHLMDTVRSVSSMANPLGGTKKLANLRQFLSKNVEITGKEDGDYKSLEDIVSRAREKGAELAKTKRTKVKNRITRKGANYPNKGKLLDLARRMGIADEDVQRLEALHARPGSAGGSELTDAETQSEIAAIQHYLGLAQKKRAGDIQARGWLRAYRTKMDDQIKEATPRESASHWKLGAFIAGKKSAGTALAGIRSDLEALVGASGRFGLIFQLKDKIANLQGTAVTDSSDTTATDALISLLRDANMRNLVLSRQFSALQGLGTSGLPGISYMGAYAKGGVAKVGELGPELVGMPEGARILSARETRDSGGVGNLSLAVTVHEDGTADAVLTGPDFERRVEAVVKKVSKKSGRTVGSVPGRGGYHQ